ncbi:MAG: T9SS type A sorting domain-containing protein [bacterium]|nr:T9SS type A sorting domain-containing protein [bacterium]
MKMETQVLIMLSHKRILTAILPLIALLFSVTIYSVADQASQTNWVGGPNEPGPVTDFGNTYDTSEDINWEYFPGTLRLANAISGSEPPNHIADRAGDPYDIQSEDLEADGDYDVVIAGHNSGVVCYRNNGNGTFDNTPIVIIDVTWPAATICDFLDNNYFDIIHTDDAYIYVYYNKENITDPDWSIYTISDYFQEVDGTAAVDIDDDGDLDIIGSCYQNYDLRWYENPNEWPPSGTWTRHNILSNYQGQNNTEIPAGDLDGDDLVDFVICREAVGQLDWWENIGGPDYFDATSQHNIATGLGTIRNAVLGDIDEDGDLDIVTCSMSANSIDWWENNGSATFTRHNISSSYNGAYDVDVGDLDQDGFIDILSSAQNSDTLDIWENDGNFNFAANHTVLATGYNEASGVLIENIYSGSAGPELLTCNMNGGSDGSVDYWMIVDGYEADGELISSIYDTGDTTNDWHTIGWNANTPGGTSVKFQVRGSANAGDMGAWSSDITSPGSLSGFLDTGDRYFQYKTILETTDNAVTPRLQDVTFIWDNTSVDGEDPLAPTSFSLGSAYPNPATEFATISFALPEACDVTLDLYDVKGRKISTLARGDYQPGVYKLAVGGLSSGLYLYTLNAGEFADSKKMVVK